MLLLQHYCGQAGKSLISFFFNNLYKSCPHIVLLAFFSKRKHKLSKFVVLLVKKVKRSFSPSTFFPSSFLHLSYCFVWLDDRCILILFEAK